MAALGAMIVNMWQAAWTFSGLSTGAALLVNWIGNEILDSRRRPRPDAADTPGRAVAA